MSSRKARLGIGIALMASFIAVLVVFFMPVFNGMNGLDSLDTLYNSISKGSAYYIPKVQQMVGEHGSKVVTLNLTLANPATAIGVEPLFSKAGTITIAEGNNLEVEGDLEVILGAALADADLAYHNNDTELEAAYGRGAREVMFGWWTALREMERDLKRQRIFDAADLAHSVQTKTVECAYNYYGIEPQKISEKWGIVLFSLVFYVVYTIWYGYAIMYIFEGLGFELTAH